MRKGFTGALALAAGAAVLSISLAGCSSTGSSNTGQQQEAQQQQADTTQLELVLPLPKFSYSFLRYEYIVMEAIQAFGISSTSFFFNQGIDHPIDSCPSVGLPIPADSSLSNPWQPYRNPNDDSVQNTNVAVGQIDPNGLYFGPTTATYVLCKTATGGTYMVHAEEFVHAVTAQAYWDPNKYGPGKGGIHVVGEPQVPVCTQIKQTGTGKDANGNNVPLYSSICYKPGHVPAGVKPQDWNT